MRSEKFYMLFLVFVVVFFSSCSNTDGPSPPVTKKNIAFPFAEGGGKYSEGGRGGIVRYVTNLNDAGEGSLREAINWGSNTTIVFSVSGTIKLLSRLVISNSNITIAGQTAPGKGITIRDQPVYITGSNIIVRFIRFRMGDAATIKVQDDALGAQGTRNVLIDHCSLSWSTDECGSFYNNRDFTLQWCILSESLNNSVHIKGAHGYGGIWGGNNATFHHNLLANHSSRNPRFDHDGVSSLRGPIDFVNNVMYNWGGNSSYGGENRKINIVNNYYKSGAASSSKNRIFNPSGTTVASGSEYLNPDGQYFITGNYVYGYPATTADNWTTGVQGITSSDKTLFKVSSPFSVTAITAQTAEAAYQSVLSLSGASLVRDTVDSRIIDEVTRGVYIYAYTQGDNAGSGSNGSTNGLIDSQADVGGWPEEAGVIQAQRPAGWDTDADGMPDAWEDANGLNKNNPADRNTKIVNADYTNLEVYLNSLVNGLYP